ncbi:saccharopine dehydrogenase family protein [Sedimenticola selenatireducens]|uniref:Saccharopine dehydrogenase n=1 Tax=Sedimenticola selenatireducens TaxID=191960 RepID=A0A2N6CTQ5_9GAMM|nr:saccharopine dehydrogenase family protein [Sedimenticola selenatireducens]PLX60546.1 MAG: saccharopine dehydrogenase [Sedimenticola selenatireducens]
MSTVLIIGAGGVGRVVAHKCAQVPEVFSEIHLASRTRSKCDQIAAEVTEKTGRTIKTAQVDADKVPELVALIKQINPVMVINVPLPYQDLTIMDACLETGVHYLDTANYEPLDEAKFEYKWQWAYRERFEQAGLMALLGSGFDPGVTNVFCAHMQKHHFDQIDTVDILDCNGGDHGYAFATNFNPEINIREVTANGRYYENGVWVETQPMEIHHTFDFEQVGPKKMYLLYHEEMESLSRNIKGVKRMRFWMTFGDAYLKHLEVFRNIGLDSIEPILFEGREIVPIQFLKALLPDPASLGPRTVGKTNIGCIVKGSKDVQPVSRYVYNICDHQECYRETNAQGVSYTTGVPAMIGAMMMLTGKWMRPGVWNMEEFDPDPFMAALNQHGLPWTDIATDIDVDALPE